MLPVLIGEDLRTTRDYLRDVCLALGAFQRGFLAREKHLWHYGLEVTMRGISTQAFNVSGQETRASIDMMRGKVRIGNVAWSLKEYSGPEIYKNIRVWLESAGAETELEQPEFTGAAAIDAKQSKAYAEALWWFEAQFRNLKAGLEGGLASPILLYPHHFDLAMSWFPWDDERQFTLGFSTGDDNVFEPYVYLTTYPEHHGFQEISLPAEARWQQAGFSGAVLPYVKLQASDKPEQLLQAFSQTLLLKGRTLLA